MSQSDIHKVDDSFKGQLKSAKYTAKVTGTGAFTPRKFHTAISYEDFMFVFAGCLKNDVATSDLACFHYATRSWSLIENESSQKLSANTRWGHSAALYGDSMFIYGGTSERFFIMEDLLEFKFETQSWSIIVGEGTRPGPRYGHSATVHENVMYVFGGQGIDDKPYNDMYELNLDTFRWSKIDFIGSTQPVGRLNHSAVVFKDSIFIFGGNDGNTCLGDFWEYKIKNKTWSLINVNPCPSIREGHTAVVLPGANSSMYLLGGSEESLEIFQFDFDYRKWYKVQPVGEGTLLPKRYHTAVVRGECIFIVGGQGESSNDLDYLCVGKDDFEEEFEADEMAKMQTLPKSQWEAVAMRRHPELLELRERLVPITGDASYSRNLFAAKTENKQSLSHQNVLQLIMEHLDREGYSKVVESIEEETGLGYFKEEKSESRLMTLLRIGRRRIHKDLLVPNIKIPEYDDADPEIPHVDHRRIDDKEEQEINIWNEPVESRRNMLKIKEDNDKVVIRAATLNKLVQYLTSEKEKSHDVNFMKIFLYTYQSFTTPEMLLKKLIQRYHVPLPKGMPEDRFKVELQQPIRNRVCNVMKFWVDKCSWDFSSSEKMVQLINNFIDGPLSRDGNLSLVKQLRNSIGKLHRKKLSEEDRYVFGVNPPEPKVPKQIFSTNLNLIQVEEIEIARQMTLLEFNLFAQIAPSELLNESWIHPDLRHKAPHIIEMKNRYEQVSNGVVSAILTCDVTNKKNRAKMLERWIKIAENLKILKNFQSLFAVVAGLNSPFLSRLTQTFAELPPRSREVLSDLSTIVSKENNYSNYKEVLRFSATPCLPFLDVLLEDLLIIEEQHPDHISGLINFQKRQLLFRAINQIQGYQQIPYNLQPVHQIASIMNLFVVKSEEDLRELSLKCEPVAK